MSYKQDLSNNIFDFQSHFKTTAAFRVNKLFFLLQQLSKFDLYIHETYMHFLWKHLQASAFCILTSNQSRKIHRKLPMSEPFFIEVPWKKDSDTAVFLRILKNFKNTFLQTFLGDCLCRSWREVVLSMINFKEC